MLGHRPLKPVDYLHILQRRIWYFVVPMVLCPVIALAISFMLPPKYVSYTQVLIDQQKVPDDYVKPVVSEDLDDRLASMKEQILSRSRLQPIIERFNLYPGTGMDERLDATRKDIDIKPITPQMSRATGLPGFTIFFKASDPHIAQQACGEITSLFVGANIKARSQSAQGTTDFLESQLAEAKSNLDAQDSKLADFERKYLGRLPNETSPNMNMLTSLNTQLSATSQQLARMEQDRAYQQSILASITNDNGNGTEPKVIAANDERLVQLQALQNQKDELSTRYTSDYPDVVAVQRKIDDLKRDIQSSPKKSITVPGNKPVESVNLLQLRAAIRASDEGINAKRAEELKIQTDIRMYQDRLQSSPLVEEEYKAVTRDYQTAQKFYDDLLAKINQAKMARSLETQQQGEQFSVLDAPNLPDSPVFPKRPLFGFGGLALGILIGLGLTVLLEYRNTAIRSDEDIHAFLSLPTLATISFVNKDGALPKEAPKPEKLKGIPAAPREPGRFRFRKPQLQQAAESK